MSRWDITGITEMTDDNNSTKKKKGCLKWFLIGAAIIIALIVIVSLFGSEEKTKTNEKKTESNVENNQEENSDVLNKEATRTIDSVTWHIQTSVDEMTDSENIWATIRSDNYINQDFPYEGKTYASITVRYMKQYGYDILINIDRGQIVGSDINGSNFVRVRFDEEAPKKYYFNNAADYSTETVFLKNAKEFMEKCKHANSIKVEIPLYDAGNPVFSFHVDKPLNWPK